MIVGGGDSAFDWVVNLLGTASEITLVHRRDGFRAHEATVSEVMEHVDAGRVDLKVPYVIKGVEGNGEVEAVELHHAGDETEPQRLECDAVLLQLGFSTKLGPLKEWGFEIQKGALVVDGLMKTNLDRVWACGDITTFDGKLKLIATGFAESAIAVSQAVHTIRPDMKIQPAYSTNTGVPSAGGRRGPRLSADLELRHDPVMAALIDDFGGPLPHRARRPRAAGRTSTARSCARSPASSSPCSRRARSGASCSRTSTAACRRRGRSSPRTPRRCAPPPASRAPRSPTCARWPSTCSTGELELDRLTELSDEEAIRELTAVKGIGEWTAHMFLMFTLHRPDVLPVGDLGVRNAAMQAYGLEEPPTPAELEALARGVAAIPHARQLVPVAQPREPAALNF